MEGYAFWYAEHIPLPFPLFNHEIKPIQGWQIN